VFPEGSSGGCILHWQREKEIMANKVTKKPVKAAAKKAAAKKKVSAARDISKKYKDKGKFSSLDARRKAEG